MIMSDRKYVLLVEDDQDIRELIIEAFRLLNIDAETAVSGDDAIQKLKILPQKPALILLDLVMPKTDGLWFCEERKKYSEFMNIPIILLTADSKAASKTASINIDGILKKPIKIDDLLHAVQPYVEGNSILSAV